MIVKEVASKAPLSAPGQYFLGAIYILYKLPTKHDLSPICSHFQSSMISNDRPVFFHAALFSLSMSPHGVIEFFVLSPRSMACRHPVG
uniref:Uncharacterized protein n=1 Tax=Anopheles atroparvus TaxID=41427 RepID=A0AAG5D2T8_ANOAO